jgi:hypothetical protein
VSPMNRWLWLPVGIAGALAIAGVVVVILNGFVLDWLGGSLCGAAAFVGIGTASWASYHRRACATPRDQTPPTSTGSDSSAVSDSPKGDQNLKKK